MQVGVIGCGNMGGGMVRQLVAAGMSPICFDPNQATCDLMRSAGAEVATSASQLASKAQIIILSLPKAAVVEEVMGQIMTSIQPKSIILDTSTSDPATSQKMAALSIAQGAQFIDGPVSGGPEAANAGTMTMLLGGDVQAIDALRPVLDVITAKTVVVGGSGAGHAAKIANNMLCAANLVLVAEAVRLGEASGVSAKDLLAGINAGSGRSGVSEVNFPKWVLSDAFDSGFTMGLMRKDVGLALDLAKSSGVDVAGFSGIADIWLNRSDHVADTADFNEIVKYADKDRTDV